MKNDHTQEVWDRSQGDCPADKLNRQLIRAFRDRGTPEPENWDQWGEFDVLIQGGRVVHVLYDPSWISSVHFSFYGPVSETGYRSHFIWKEEMANLTVAEAARQIACQLAEKYGQEDEKKFNAKRVWMFEPDRRQPTFSCFWGHYHENEETE